MLLSHSTSTRSLNFAPVNRLVFTFITNGSRYLIFHYFSLFSGVRHIFCGHCHRNAGGFYKDLELVITSAIGMQIGSDKSGIRIVKVKKNEVSHKYYPLEEVPSAIAFN